MTVADLVADRDRLDRVRKIVAVRSVTVTVTVVAVLACGSSDGPVDFADSAQRQCAFSRAKREVTCDRSPVEPRIDCPAHRADACYKLMNREFPEDRTLLCRTCCSEIDSALAFEAECSLIVCSMDAGCPLKGSTCSDGFCTTGNEP